MTIMELRDLHVKVKKQWIEENIQRLKTLIKINETIYVAKNHRSINDNEELAYRKNLLENELERFQEMKKKETK